MRRPIYKSYKSSFKPRSIRKSESRATRKLMFNLVLVVAAVFIFFMWGLPFIINSLSFLNKGKANAEPVSAIDEAIAPPVLFIPYEATNSATLPISGYSTPETKVELYIDDTLKSEVTTDSDGKFTAQSISLNSGTNNIYALTVNEEGKKSLPSKTIKLLYSSEKPTLEVSQPTDGAQINGGDKKITVAGETDPNNSVTVNGQTVIVNSEGNFSSSIGINDGDNIITITAANSFGNTNQVQRTVRYTPQEPSPSPSP